MSRQASVLGFRSIIELRRRYTGETHQQAMKAVSRTQADGSTDWWPAASTDDQVRLEARIFRRLSTAETNFGFGPLMLTGVTPWPDCLTMHVRPDALAAVLGALLPWNQPGTAAGTPDDLWGVSGLRARGRGDSIILYRPAATGKILIPTPKGVASQLVDELPSPFELDALALWRESPAHITPIEVSREEEIVEVVGTVDWILSGLLRRAGLVVASPTPTCWVSYWINPGDAGPEVQWEWCHGDGGAVMARRLLTGPCALPMAADIRGEEAMASAEERQINLHATAVAVDGVLSLRPNTFNKLRWWREPLSRKNPRQQALESLHRASFGAESLHREFRRHRTTTDGAE